MIVGRAVCKLLDNMTITVGSDNVIVKNNMGNQDALDKFIALSDKKGVSKYPLVFYVINNVNQDDGTWKYCDTNLIIMMNTDSNLLYKDRADKTYIPYIEPIYNKIKSVFSNSPYIQVFADLDSKKYPYDDIPNFGITKNEVGSGTSKKSVVTDYVDARVIKLKFRINTNCI